MDQFSTEEEQIAAIKKFWKENGIPIVVGAVLGLGGLWGWRYYNEQQLIAQEQASDAYKAAVEQLNADESGFTKASEFIETHKDSAYAVLTALQLAKEAVEREDLAEAEKQLSWAADNVTDVAVKDLALVRLARVQNERENYEAAKATLDKVTSEAFMSQVHAVKGDVLASQGQYGEAQASYAKALELQDNNNPILQMKIDHLNAKVNG